MVTTTTSQPDSDPSEAIGLGTSLTIADVGELYGKLLTTLDASAVRLDGASISRVDACGVQLLVSFLQTRQSKELATHWAGVSADLQAAFSDLGLASSLPGEEGPT
ncbi:MAG: STAS domain-containing protein [Myxococcota bacterium]